MAGTIRAKFYVSQVTENADGGEVVLHPVISGSPENQSYFKWTPYGEFKMGLLNKETLREFIPGASYYVDFTLVNIP